ncbi:MAG: ABC transporter substrate-binding protein [Paracoccaceae bacterium]
MRRLFPALALSLGLTLALAAGPAGALEVEDQIRIGPDTPQATLHILSTTDIAAARPMLDGWLARNPDLAVDYVVASANEIHQAITAERLPFDLVISSAMDLQLKLANDGHALPQDVDEAAGALPHWARWRDLVFGFALEPVVIVASASAFDAENLPRTRRDLITALRDDPDRFRGRIGTYDPAQSGAGYLFATQDASFGNTFWRLAEVMGRLDARLYCCSGDMIDDLASDRLLVAYNVVGSYAQVSTQAGSGLIIIAPEDFTLLLIRTALVPTTAERPDLGAAFLGYLLSPAGQAAMETTPGMAPVLGAAQGLPSSARAIRLDPGLLANLDRVRKSAFLGEWTAAMTQP